MRGSSDGRSTAPPLGVAPGVEALPDSEGRRPKAERERNEQEAHVPLRLAVTRGALGLELYEPVSMGPLEICELSLILPGLKFPLDLSGGVPSFRNRRGDLERLVIAAGLDALARFARPRLSDVVGPLLRPVALWSTPPVISVGLVGAKGALAFDLIWAPVEQSARFIVANARGAELAGPALGYALRALDSFFGREGKRDGRSFELSQVASRIGRTLLPAVGARAPGAVRVRFGELRAEGDALEVALDSTFAPLGLSPEAASALELALAVRDADDALAKGDLDGARRAYVAALENAPRHPELARAIAEIDVAVGHRTEAALGLLQESQPVMQAGAVAVELLAQVGDRESARETAMTLGRLEPYGSLAALYWKRAAELEPNLRGKLLALDHAVARAPALDSVRALRLSVRLEARDVQGALGDAEHLEASATGARARHGVCLSCARQLFDAGFVREAGKLFERALRYVPSDASATAGLGRACLAFGRADRALALLERAVTLAETSGQSAPEALVDLAELLASYGKDLPQAIARVRQVPASAACAVRARGLEARFREALGDLVGASLAYARTREAIELRGERGPAALGFLREAARFERVALHDPIAAERHLAVALRLAPADEDVRAGYREVAAEVAELVRAQREGRTRS